MPSRAALRAASRIEECPACRATIAAIIDAEFADAALALRDLVGACTPPQMPSEYREGTITGVRVPERDVVAQARAALAKVRPDA